MSREKDFWSHLGGSRGGTRPSPLSSPLSLLLDQTEARRAETIFLGNRPPSPPYQRVWETSQRPLPPFPHLSVWIRHCCVLTKCFKIVSGISERKDETKSTEQTMDKGDWDPSGCNYRGRNYDGGWWWKRVGCLGCIFLFWSWLPWWYNYKV